MKRIIIGSVVVIAVAALWVWQSGNRAGINLVQQTAEASSSATSETAASDSASTAVATLAGGCFWCLESTFEKIDGISEVVSGYTGGHVKDPTYQQVGAGGSGHTEAVQIYYDPAKISYPALLHYLWREIDPTDARGQFVDRGSMYRPAIYYQNESEKATAIASRDQLAKSGRFNKPIAIEITEAQPFYKAESYHQNYYKTTPYRYKVYRRGSGRDQYLKKTWGAELHSKYKAPDESAQSSEQIDDDATSQIDGGHSKYRKPDEATLKQSLTDIQYAVTQQEGTEPPYRNEFWDNKARGIYVDVVSGEPLFSSTDKYKSNTGWPSFSQPLDPEFLVEKVDYKLLFPRTELRSKYGDSHLGHIFDDGPAPTGLRYCINSAALRFVPAKQLKQEGYGEYVGLFE